MKKMLPTILLLMFSAIACSLPGVFPADPALTPTTIPTNTPIQSPTIIPTSTPTPIPTHTPTPIPEMRIAEADHALFNGDYQSALNEYSNGYNNSDDPDILSAALLGQGRIHYLTGAYPNALNEFRTIIQNYPDSSQVDEAHYFMAETLMLLDRYDEAAGAYKNYLDNHPGKLDSFINERHGDALMAVGDFNAALTAFTNAIQSPHLHTNFLLELKLAQTYVLVGDYATAQVVYEDIYSRTGSEDIKAKVDYALGQMYTLLGQTEQATAAYLDAVFKFPEAYYSYLSLIELVNAGYPIDELQRGLVDYYADQYGVAMAAFDRYLAADPTDPSTAQFYNGQILRLQDDTPGAISYWDLVIQGDSASPIWDAAWEQKAYTQWAYQGDYVSAEKTLLDFVAAAPEHSRAAEFLFDAGRVAERDGRLEEAAKIWQRLPVEYPNSEYVYRALFLTAICYYRLGDYAVAEDLFLQVQGLAATPAERAGAYFWTGKSQAAHGDEAAARSSWQQAAPIDPTGYYSERSRDLLNDHSPFTPPQVTDLGIDHQSELRQAELWMRTTFNYPSETDFSVPGPIASDPRFIRGQEYSNLGLHDLAEAEFSDLRESAAADPLTLYRLAVYLSDLGM